MTATDLNSDQHHKKSTSKSILSVVSIPGFGVTLAFLILCIFLSFANKNFLTVGNLTVVTRQSVWVALMAIGMTFIIGMAEIDLSVGAILAVTGLAAAIWIQNGMNIYLAIFLSLLLGAAIGAVNGILVTVFRLPSFVATLGSMSVIRGFIMVITGGVPIYGLRYPEFQFIGQGFLGPAPVPVIILLLLFLVAVFLLNKTSFGRHTLAIGSNATAASFAGISINKIKITVFMISGFLCGVAGLILASRSEAATADAGLGMELDVIAATVIGGTPMTGGKAVLYGTVIGALLMTTIRNGLNLMGVSPLWHQVVIGALIIVAVAGSMLTQQNTKEA